MPTGTKLYNFITYSKNDTVGTSNIQCRTFLHWADAVTAFGEQFKATIATVDMNEYCYFNLDDGKFVIDDGTVCFVGEIICSEVEGNE